MTNPVLAEMLGLEPLPWNDPIAIEFGNAEVLVSTHYVCMGDLIGNVALLDSARITILPRQALHRNRVSLVFRSNNNIS